MNIKEQAVKRLQIIDADQDAEHAIGLLCEGDIQPRMDRNPVADNGLTFIMHYNLPHDLYTQFQVQSPLQRLVILNTYLRDTIGVTDAMIS